MQGWQDIKYVTAGFKCWTEVTCQTWACIVMAEILFLLFFFLSFIINVWLSGNVLKQSICDIFFASMLRCN